MPRSADARLLAEVHNENTRGVEHYLAAGASINGSEQSGEEYPPVVWAAAVGSANMVRFLLQRGANVDGATWRHGRTVKKSRAIHAVVTSGYSRALDVLEVVLEARPDVNAKNAQGCTALMMVCRVEDMLADQRFSMARELLKAGANVTLQNADGRMALHYASFCGYTDLVEMLLSGGGSERTVNHATLDGKTPLTAAVESNHGGVVSLLLSAGASQKGLLDTHDYQCPFKHASAMGCVDILRMFSSERGMDAVGGSRVIPTALSCVATRGRARILSMVLAAEGEERQTYWANRKIILGRPMLNMAAAYGILANVQVLLAAGAYEAMRDPEDSTASDVIGMMHPPGVLDPREEAAIDRELQRGPAYRARSWAWPIEETGVGAAAAGPLDAQITRPRSQKFFTSLIGR